MKQLIVRSYDWIPKNIRTKLAFNRLGHWYINRVCVYKLQLLRGLV